MRVNRDKNSIYFYDAYDSDCNTVSIIKNKYFHKHNDEYYYTLSITQPNGLRIEKELSRDDAKELCDWLIKNESVKI